MVQIFTLKTVQYGPYDIVVTYILGKRISLTLGGNITIARRKIRGGWVRGGG